MKQKGVKLITTPMVKYPVQTHLNPCSFFTIHIFNLWVFSIKNLVCFVCRTTVKMAISPMPQKVIFGKPSGSEVSRIEKLNSVSG